MRKACRLVMDHLLFELQPHLQELLSRTWLDQGDVTSNMCGVLERHCEIYNRVREPCRQVSVYTRHWKLHGPHNKMSVYLYQQFVVVHHLQRLKEECQWLTVVEYVRALMQKRLVCRSNDERNQLAQRMSQDAQQLRDHLQSMVNTHLHSFIWVFLCFRCN